MKHLDNPQTNTKQYWNYIYGDFWKRAEYDQQGTLTKEGRVGNMIIRPTARFSTALTYMSNGDKVIDIGCGVGSFTKMAKKTYPMAEVWGVDMSDKAIEDNLKEGPDIKYKQGYVGHLDFLSDSYFDLAFAGEVIEHLDNPDDVFKESYRILKEKGKLIITTPVEDHVCSNEHVWEFNKQDIENLYHKVGFKDVRFVQLPDMEYMIVFFAIGMKGGGVQ